MLWYLGRGWLYGHRYELGWQNLPEMQPLLNYHLHFRAIPSNL